MNATHDSTLICTLGGQPQIVTFALDYLLARSETVTDLFVFHLSPGDGRIEHSLRCLYRELDGNQYQGQPCRFRAIALKQGSELLPAIRTEAEAEAVRSQIFSLIAELKRTGRTLHLCIAGGPRIMGLMGLSAAGLFCGHQDKVWHMYTEPEFRRQANEGAVMHDDSGESGPRVRLVQVPLVPWGAYVPPLLKLQHGPAELMSIQTAWMDQEERQRCHRVWDALTGREREALRGLAGGLDAQQVADEMGVAIKTVHGYKTKILSECRNAWHIPPDSHVTYHFVREHFRTFFR